MVKINSFKGITYNFNKLDPDMKLFAPPYDVINSTYQDELYKRSPYNIVRLILGKIYKEDDESNNRYTRAAKDYNQWLKEDVIVKSDEPCIYYYIQKYKDSKGIDVIRKGFISWCYLEELDSGQVLPHEETMGGPKEDRLSLMKATKANFSQIFAVYSDPDKQIDSILGFVCPKTPMVDVTDDDNVRHMFYKISDKESIEKVQSLMKQRPALIADGHHRYETALNYRNFRRAQDNNNTSENKPYNSVMFYFANLDDEGLRIYPTHRALKQAVDISLNDLLEKLRPYFSLKELKINTLDDSFPAMEKEDIRQIPIGIVCKQKPDTLYVLIPDCKKITALLKEQGVPEILSKLDLTILHRFIFEQIMGLDTVELKKQSNIEFVRNETELVDKFNNNEAEYVFLMSTPDLQMFKEICLAGHRMPQKSTYFYPKLLSGLVVNALE